MKIVLWNEHSEQANFSACGKNSAINYSKKIQDEFKKQSISFEEKIIPDYVEKNDLNLFVIELKFLDDAVGLFKKQRKEIFQFLNQNNIKILFHYPREGFNLDPKFLILYNELKDVDLKNCQKFLIYSNLNVQSEYRAFKKEYGIDDPFIKIYSIDYFRQHYRNTLDNLNEDYLNRNLFHLNKKKDFVCYNGKIRLHRLFATYELKKRHLLDNALYSFIGETVTSNFKNNEDYIKELNKFTYNDNKLVEYIKNWKPIYLDKKPKNFTNSNFDKVNETIDEHYSQTFFSLISETTVSSLFVTEKTYKPILNEHPFIIIGCLGILKYLRGLGFKTYPEFFDESYDDIINPKDRIIKIIDEIDEFCNLPYKAKMERYISVQDKVEYNKKIFLNITQGYLKERYMEIMKDIHES